MANILRDLRQAWRGLAANPSVTLVAVIALALGIGANSAVFSVVDAVFLRPMPHFRDPAAVYYIWGASPAKNVPFHGLTYSDVVDIRRQTRSFDAVAAVMSGSANLSGVAGAAEPERVRCWQVNADFFTLAGTGFVQGRGILPEEDRPGGPRVAVISHALWQRRFGGSASIVGSAVLLDGNSHIVTGILPSGFTMPGANVDLYVPFALAEARDVSNTRTTAQALARLKRGVTPAQAQAELDTVIRRLQQDANVETGALRLWGLRDFVIRDLRTSVLVLLGAVALVLLIACANVANLLLARGAARQREMAVRIAMGAPRHRLIGQLLWESLLLAASGGALGVAAAYGGVATLSRIVPLAMPLVGQASIDARVLGFTLAVALATSIVFGIVPALVGSRSAILNEALRQGSRGGEPAGHNRLRASLVVAEVSLALILLTGAGLLIRSFHHLIQVSPGFNPEGVLTASVTLPPAKYATHVQREAFYHQLIEKLEATPGVQSAGATSLIPLNATNNGIAVFVEGRPVPRRGEYPIAWYRSVSAGYFRAMRIPLRRGRLFTAADTRDAPLAAIVNETMARRYWPNDDAVGKRFSFRPPQPGQPVTWVTVAGVIADLHHRGLSQPPDAEVYFPFTQPPFTPNHVVLRTAAVPARFAPVLRSLVREIDPNLPVSQVRPMQQILEESIATPRLSVFVLSLFAAIALLLAAVGIYGVISYSVTRRTREIGIRIAMGALPADVTRDIAGRALRLAAVGLAIGACASLGLTRLLRSILFGVSPTDPLVFALVALLLLTVAGLAGWIPARRAARLDPLAALREE